MATSRRAGTSRPFFFPKTKSVPGPLRPGTGPASITLVHPNQSGRTATHATKDMSLDLLGRPCKTAAIVLTVLSCIGSAQAQPQVLMKSGDLAATTTDVKAVAEALQDQQRRNTYGQPENVRRQAEEVLLRRWLAQKAVAAGLDKDANTATRVQQAREHVLSEAWMNKQVDAATPSPDALTRYAQELYRSQPEKFKTGEEWLARHILVTPSNNESARAKAQSILTQLKAGASFEALAKAESSDKASGARGGDLGWFGAGTMVKPFQDAVASLAKPGDLSAVVESQFGYHVIRLDGKRPAGVRAFDEVRPDLEREVLAALKRSAREQLIAQAMPNPTTDTAAIEALAREFAKP